MPRPAFIPRSTRLARLSAFALLLATVIARADEKELLADRIMQPDYDTLETASDQHVRSNREGSEGGYGAAGGGCGCN